MTSITPPDPQLKGLQARLLDFQHAMRDAGVPVAISDGMDAMRAARAVPLVVRDVFRESLAATLTSSASHRMAFDTLFDIYFPRTHAMPDEDEAPAGSAPGEGDPRDIQDFLADLIDQLMQGDDAALRAMAREAVASYGRVENADGSQSYFAYRVYRNFNLKGLLRRLMGEAGIEDDDLVSRLMADEFEARLRRFREEIDAEIRRRQVEQRGPEAIAKRAARPLPEDVDFFSITADEQAHMRKAVRPLARKLATRLAVKRKRARDGSGGVPIDPAFRAKKIHRPELVLICDVSGSVAAFAKFTLMFTHALQGQFSRVRSFAFIDTCDEVTHLFADGDFSGGMARMQTEADLNPEPAVQWDSGDSVASDYALVCDRMVECRNLNQLASFIETIA